MIRAGKYVILPALFMMLFASCISLSSLQTGRTAGKGHFELSAGASAVQFSLNTDSAESYGFAPLIEVSGRYGITERFDLGARASIIGTGGIEAKYQLAGDQQSPFALSLGLSTGFLQSEVLDKPYRLIDVAVPVYISYHPEEWFAVYGVPRFAFRSYTGQSSGTQLWFGGGGGARFGRKAGLMLETSYLSNNAGINPFLQYSLGLNIRF